MTSNEIIKECRKLAKEQNIVFRRAKTVNTINGYAAYELESGIQYKVLYQAPLTQVWGNLLNESFSGL